MADSRGFIVSRLTIIISWFLSFSLRFYSVPPWKPCKTFTKIVNRPARNMFPVFARLAMILSLKALVTNVTKLAILDYLKHLNYL